MDHLWCILVADVRCAMSFFFFFNDTATTEIYTLSLHDALPISRRTVVQLRRCERRRLLEQLYSIDAARTEQEDRKSTRLNSSHGYISYAVFCLKKKKQRRWRLICRRLSSYPQYGGG